MLQRAKMCVYAHSSYLKPSHTADLDLHSQTAFSGGSSPPTLATARLCTIGHGAHGARASPLRGVISGSTGLRGPRGPLDVKLTAGSDLAILDRQHAFAGR
jgi:hypothetical protein